VNISKQCPSRRQLRFKNKMRAAGCPSAPAGPRPATVAAAAVAVAEAAAALLLLLLLVLQCMCRLELLTGQLESLAAAACCHLPRKRRPSRAADVLLCRLLLQLLPPLGSWPATTPLTPEPSSAAAPA
jgi:hypothetical protein